MASISPREFKRRIRQAKAELEQQRKSFALKMALDGLALLKQRIQGRGLNSEGSRFKPYTKEYAKYGRQEKGYQSNYVDFTRTGRLFASIVAKVVNDGKGKTAVEIAPRDAENQKKVDGAFRKRGNILEWSRQEVDFVRKANNLRVERIINKIFQ